jgi:HK97 gp10 family phage protein
LPGEKRSTAREGTFRSLQLESGDPAIQIEFDLIIDEGTQPVTDETINTIQDDARRILEEGAENIESTARALAPVRTGALQASIYAEVQDVKGIIVGARRSYARFVEYGTHRMAPRPYLAPAINEHQPMIQEALDNMIAENLSRDTSEENPELEFDVETEAVQGP